MAFFEMAKTALRTVIKRPATLMYPVKPSKQTRLSRGHVFFDGSKCISCGLCMKKCPTGAICVRKEVKTWEIDRLRCVVCNACVDVCPVKCLGMDPQYTAAMTVHEGIEQFAITYVRPERPQKAAEEAKGAE